MTQADGHDEATDRSSTGSPGDAPTGTSVSITITDPAVERLQEVIAGQQMQIAGIRVAIVGRGPEGFQHSLSLIEDGEQDQSDQIVEIQGLTVLVESRNAAYLDGVVIDYDGDTSGGMIKFQNPNPLWIDEASDKIQNLIDTQLNPQIASHGGMVTLHGVDGSVAYIELGGGCVGCGMVDVTLKQGIEVAIKDAVPEIESVVDVTDHNSGSNPYYKPSKK